MLMVANRVDKEIISNATTKFMAVPNNFLFFRATIVMIRKIRPRRAKSIVTTIRGFDSIIFSLSNTRLTRRPLARRGRGACHNFLFNCFRETSNRSRSHKESVIPIPASGMPEEASAGLQRFIAFWMFSDIQQFCLRSVHISLCLLGRMLPRSGSFDSGRPIRCDILHLALD